MQQTRLRWGLTNTGSTSVTASLALLVCICSPAASLANQPLPPPELPDQLTSPPTLRVRPAIELTLGKLVARFEQTTLSRLTTAAGGIIGHRGDAGDAIYWLCYTSGTHPGERVWIVSNAEMGGPEQVITEVIAERVVGARSSPECPMLPPQLRPLSLNRGIWLGATRQQLIRTLGAPSGVRDDWLVFLYEGKAGELRKEMTEVNALEVRVVDDRAVLLRASKITSD